MSCLVRELCFKKLLYKNTEKREGGREKYWDWLRIARKEDPCMLGGEPGKKVIASGGVGGGAQSCLGSPKATGSEMLRKTAATRWGSPDRMSLCGGCWRQIGGTKTSSESQGTLTNGITGPKWGEALKLPDGEHLHPILRHREVWEVRSQTELAISMALGSLELPLVSPKPLGPGPDHLPSQGPRNQKFTSVVSPAFSAFKIPKQSSINWGHMVGMGVYKGLRVRESIGRKKSSPLLKI